MNAQRSTSGRRVVVSLVAGLSLAGWTSLASGQTLRVPEEFATIQAAVNAAPRAPSSRSRRARMAP